MPAEPVPPTFKVVSPEDDSTPSDQPLQLTPELLDELKRKSEELEPATPREILRWAVHRFAPQFTMATAFGPEGMVLIHLLAEIAPDTPIFNLDTGYQFPETLELRERIKVRYGIDVELKRSALTVEQYEALHGGPVYKKNPDQCCADRKLKVLFEGRGRKPGQIVGRSPYLQAVHAEGPSELIGEIVEVDILAAGPNSLHGVINLGFAWREPVQAAV